MSFLKSAFFVAFLVSMMFATTAQGQPERRPSNAELLGRFTPVEIADYRQAIRDTFTVGHEIARMANNAATQKLIEQRMKMVDSISDADLARLMSYGADFGEFRDSMIALRDAIHPPAQGETGRVKPLSAGFPDANYDFCGSTHGSAPILLAAQATLDIAKGVWSAASRACDQTVVIAGEGGNASLVCIIVDTALTIAETAFNAVVFCENDIDSAEINGSYRRLAHIHDDVAALQTSGDSNKSDIVNNNNTNKTEIEANDNTNRDAIITNDNNNRNAIIANSNSNRDVVVNNDNVNRNQIIANDNSNRDAIINNDNANRNQIIANDNANRDMIISNALRLAIEQSLTGSNGAPMALFQLPAPAGDLDLVRSIVRQTIDNMKANGQSVGTAESFYQQALALIAGGSYKDAFRRFQQAYQQATQ